MGGIQVTELQEAQAMIQVLLGEINYLRDALAEARATITELRKETEGEDHEA
jgi:hypothetical protein